MNRETWLNSLAEKMAPWFQEQGKPVPDFRVAIGFTSGGKSSNANGEAWHKSKSADRKYEILITPDNNDAVQVAAIEFHELCHCAAGFKSGHKGEFAKLMASGGMMRPFTTSTPGDAFKAWVAPFIEALGPLPHAALMFRQAGKAPRQDGEDGSEDDDDEGGSSNEKKKQTTRMLKASCQECDYIVRLSRKCAKRGAVCPDHGAMQIEGLQDDEEGEE